MPIEDSPFIQGMRRKTLDALRYANGGALDEAFDADLDADLRDALDGGSQGPVHSGNAGKITLDPSTASRELQGSRSLLIDRSRMDAARRGQWGTQGGGTFSIDPNAAQNWQAPRPSTGASGQWQKPDTSFNPNLDLQLGFQSGAADVGRMIYKPAEDLYGGRLASGQPLSQAVTEQLGPDPKQIAARSQPFQRGVQFAGRILPDAARYGLASIAAGGNPALGAAAADALGAETPQQAVEQGTLSGLGGAAVEYGLPALAKYGPRVAEDVASALPTREELQAAREAADARLRASGAISGARAPIGQLFDPATMRDVAISTGAQLGGGLYTVGEAAASRARLVKNWITDMRAQELTPQEQEQFAAARQSSPELNEVGDLMLPLEARKAISAPQNVEAMSRMLRVIPDSAKLAATAKMGVSKLGWYRGSSQALMDVFGEDAPRFAQLLAAMSPQTSVESNLSNALNTWKNWTAAGRPTDPAVIKRIMASSVQGGTEKSALDAWVHNGTSALSAADPMKVTLSGPKVDSFYHNLRDDVFRVTNDAWMANAYGLTKDAFAGQGKNLLAGNPGMTATYAAASARLRDAALKAGMLPSQGQETIWSTAMQLYELAKAKGIHPREVLERGLLTPEIIRGAPDFSTLLKDPTYARILEESGYGPQLQAMQPFQFPETTVPMSAAEQEQLGHVANILGETARIRGDVAQATKFFAPQGTKKAPAPPPSTGFGSVQVEGVPTDTGHFPKVGKLPYGSRETYTSGVFSGLQTPRGLPSLISAPESGIASIPTTNVIGSYVTPEEKAVVNPARSQGFTAPLIQTPEGPRVDPQFMANVRGPASVQNVMLAQQGTGIPVMVPNPEGQNLSIRLSDKALEPRQMRALQQKYPNFAFAHTGPRLHVLNINGLDLNKDMAEDMTKMVRGKKFTRADNMGDYIDHAEAWSRAPGSGAVTQKMADDVNAMTPEARNVLDQEMRDSAGKVLNFYQQKMRTQGWKPRQDLLNLLGTMRDQGWAGVQEGLRKGAFFPGLAGAFLAPHLLQHGQQNGQTE